MEGRINVKIDSSEPPEGLLAALVIDDEGGYRAAASDSLKRLGFDVDEADSIARARTFLGQRSYAFVLCDNIFGDVSSPADLGSRFLLEEWPLLRDAEVVLATGFAINQIENRDVLIERGVRIFGKQMGHMKEVKEVSKHAKGEYMNKLERALEEACGTLVEEPRLAPKQIVGGANLAARAARYLHGYISRLPRPDEKQIFFQGRGFSPRELLAEIESESDLGPELVDMLLDDSFGTEDI